jgi:hypothetical protein
VSLFSVRTFALGHILSSVRRPLVLDVRSVSEYDMTDADTYQCVLWSLIRATKISSHTLRMLISLYPLPFKDILSVRT